MVSSNIVVINGSPSLQKKLSVGGIESSILPATTVANTVKEVEKMMPDLVAINTTDKNVMNGLLCKELKRNVGTKSIPVIYINHGCQDYVEGCIDSLNDNEQGFLDRVKYYTNLGRLEKGLRRVVERMSLSEQCHV